MSDIRDFSANASGLTVSVDASDCVVMTWEGIQGGWEHTVTNVDALVDALQRAKAFVAGGGAF